MMNAKTENQWGWLYVLPVVVLVAFNAIIPLMAVVNYSTQETFGNNIFFFEGVKWFEQVLHSDRFHASLLRQRPSRASSWRSRCRSASRSRSQCRGAGRGCRSAWC
jgi:hypothetical protein